MKYIILISLIVACCFGCRGRDGYRKKFRLAVDSANYYHNRWQCCFNNKEYEKAKVFDRMADMFGDSLKKYYALMYPNGNPADKKEEEKKPDCNCN